MTTSLSRRHLLLGGLAGGAALGLAGGLAGCGRFAPASTLKIAVVSSFVGDKVRLTGLDYVIEKQGWLRDELKTHNVSLDWFPAPNAAVGPIVNEAFANHKIQFAGYSDLPSIILNASNATGKTKLIIPGNPSDSYLVVPANSTARSIEDLKGKRLAIHRGRPWELPLLRLLQSKGLSYKDFQLYNMNPDAGAAAVATGGVDGLFTVSAFNLVDKGVAKIIWSTAGQPLDWKSWGGVWAARDYLQQQPELSQIVTRAYVKAAYWLSQPENKPEFLQHAALNGTPQRILERIYDDAVIPWKDRWSPLFPPELYAHYREAVAFARQNGIITGDVNVDELLDESFVRTALKTEGLTAYWSRDHIYATPAQTSTSATGASA